MEFDFSSDFRRPVPDYLLHKQKFQINGQQFFCQESHYEDELLNGVQLRMKELRGVESNPKIITFLKQTQEIVFFISGRIVAYHTHKKIYTHLFNVKGDVLLLRTRFDRVNNRQYLLWVEKDIEDKQPMNSGGRKEKANCLKQSRIKKKTTFEPQKDKELMELDSMLQTFIGDQTGTASIDGTSKFFSMEGMGTMTNGFPSRKKVYFGSNSGSSLKIYDYTRKELIYQTVLKITNQKTITDIFFFNGSDLKVVGYITPDLESQKNHIFFKRLSDDRKNSKKNTNFDFFICEQQIQNLLYSEQECCYLFSDGRDVYKMMAYERAEDKSLLDRYIEGQQEQAEEENTVKVLKLGIKKHLQLPDKILDISANDQYIVILTANQINFYSVFDSQTLSFIHRFQDSCSPILSPPKQQPKSIHFSKNTILVTYKNSSLVTTYAYRNKGIKMITSTSIQIKHCRQILRIFVNNISSEVYCVVELMEKDTRIKTVRGLFRPDCSAGFGQETGLIDIASCYLSTASKTQVNMLRVSKQKFKKVHQCPWLSNYIVETQDSVQFRNWELTFENKRCLALHPTGIYVVLCFKEAFKIYSLTYEGMSNTYQGDSLNDIQSCAISNEGNHLAVAAGGLVHIYDFYSCSRKQSFPLPLGVSIEYLQYKTNYLCCYLKTKKLYLYDSSNRYKEVVVFNPRNYVNQNVKELQPSNIPINSLFYDGWLKVIIFSAKNHLFFFNTVTNEVIFSFELEPITCFHYCNNIKTLFLGTAKGQLINFIWPNKPENLVKKHSKMKLHGGAILSMLVSSDLKDVVTIAEDNSLCINSLCYVRNMKRMQGLELVQSLSGLQVNFDFLMRKGYFQYTHTEKNNKLDLIKDKEDQTLNMNFIMPEERAKQKEQMIGHVNDQTFQLTQVNNKQFGQYKEQTNTAKDDVGKIKDALEMFLRRSKIEKEKTKEEMFGTYMEKHAENDRAEERLKELREKYQRAKEREKRRLWNQYTDTKQRNERQLRRKQDQFQIQRQTWWKEQPQQLQMIDEERQDFIDQNINSLQEMINSINVTNSGLSLRNGNLEKQILKLRKKQEEQRYLYDRLKNNTEVLEVEKKRYNEMRREHQINLDKEDKINLVNIQKAYVKQTKLLIEKDKDIDVKIFMYNKEKNILVYLQRCVEGLQQNIQTMVQNLLEEKKSKRQEESKLTISSERVSKALQRYTNKKKDVVAAKNIAKNYIFNLMTVAERFISERKGNVLSVLMDKELISPDDAIIEEEKEKDDEVEQWIQEKIVKLSCQNSVPFADKKNVHRKSTQGLYKKYKQMRQLKTEVDESNQNRRSGLFTRGSKNKKAEKGNLTLRLKLSPQTLAQASTGRQLIEKNKKKVGFQQTNEQKTYERIKTEQVVYENGVKKINSQNQDLIETYNSLAMENKKIFDSLKKQRCGRGSPLQRDSSLKNVELSPTPFQNYIKNKGKKQKNTIPMQFFEY